MATDNHNDNETVVTSGNLQADRQYLVDSGTNRLLMTLLLVGGITIVAVLLFLASWGKTGKYVNPDTAQYQTTLTSAASMLEGGAVAADNADRVTLPIDTAIRAVADKGLGTITSSLKQTSAPPAPVVEEAVVEEIEVVETPAVETAIVEPAIVETTMVETEVAETAAVKEATEMPVSTETESMISTEATSEVVVTEAVTTTAVPTEAITETVEAQPEVVETTTVETIAVTETAPVVESTNTTVSTTSTTSTTMTNSSTNSTVLGVSPGVAGSSIVMASGLTVDINKDVYSACVSCHQVNGQGIITVFPPLANHAAKLFNADRDYLANVILYGLEGTIEVDGLSYNEPMRGYPELSDADVAGVLNYILTTWGNENLLTEEFRPYEAKDIASLRGQNLSPELMQTMRTSLDIN